MAISGVNPKCYILALFVRDDGARFLLGDDPFEFKDNQLHFQQNTMANDVVEVQGNDGYLLAGQARRPGTQMFDGYVCNGTNSKEEVEVKRRAFLQFFRRSHFYKVIYVFPNGTAIQRKQGFLVDDPTVQELYQQYPEYHVALNFEDVNYYTYEEDDQGHEIYAKEAVVPLARGGATGGLIWDNYGVVWEDPWSLPLSISGVQFQILNNAGARAPIDNVKLYGDTFQQTYNGFQLLKGSGLATPSTDSSFWGSFTNLSKTDLDDGWATFTSTASSSHNMFITRTGGFEWSVSATYTVILEIKNAPSAGLITLSQPQNANDPFDSTSISPVQYQLNGQDDVFVFSGTTKSSTTSNGLRAFLSSSFVSSVTMRLTIVAGDHVSDYQNYIGNNYQPYTNGPAPNPDYPQPIQVVTGEQTVMVTGKNLWNPNTNTNNRRLDGSGTLITDNSYMTSDYIRVKPSTTYTYSRYTSGGGSCAVCFYKEDKTFILRDSSWMGSASAAKTSLSCTTTADTSFIRICDFKTLETIQVEQGSTSTAYKPYTGQSYTLDLAGKNLLNMFATHRAGWSTTSAGVTYTLQQDGGINLDGTAGSGTQAIVVGSSWSATGIVIPLDNTKTYNVSVTRPTSDYKFYVRGIKNGSVTTLASNANASFSGCDGITLVQVEATNGVQVDGTIYLQIEEGSTATTYAPYYNYELCKIGDYQDYIYQSNGDWYVHKDITTQVLNGTENIYNKDTSGGFTRIHFSLTGQVNVGSNRNTNLRSDHFNASDANNYGTAFLNNARTYVYPQSTITTVEEFKTWLSSNNTTFYYPLASATDTQITDATLISQLNALGAMKLIIGENNVLVSTPAPNLPATLAFDYYTEFATIGAEWEEGGTKGATIVNVDAIDNTYPVWELTGPATNPTISVLTTNTALTYNGTITASQKLVIDMFNKTATLNGTSVIGNVSGDFVYMAPGTNRVAYTAGNTDAPDSTIYWQEVVG